MKLRHIFAILAIAASPFAGHAQTEDNDSVAFFQEEQTASLLSRNAGIVERINASGAIHVDIPASVEDMLVAEGGRTSNLSDEAELSPMVERQQRKVGYRVQVFDDNNVMTAKADAEKRCNMVRSRFPDMEVSIEFNSPYWRVKAGNFRTRSEAENAMAALKAAFPSLASQFRVIRDRINLQH